MTIELPLVPTSLPEDFCPQEWQQVLNEFAKSIVQFTSESFTIIINSETQPGADDRDKLWRKPSEGRIYEWDGGAWVTPHSYPANGSVRLWWEGTEAAAWSFDGGDGMDPTTNPPAASSGAMWVVDHNYDGRVPMGAGTITGAVPAKVLAVGENYGEAAHTMTAEEVGPHDHPLATQASITHDGVVDVVNTGAGDDGLLIGLTGPATTPLSVQPNEYTATQQAMPILPPLRGGFWLKRSARQNYVGS